VIRTNLATRPFYNERRVTLWLAAFAVVVLLVSAMNAIWILDYSRTDTELKDAAAADEARAADLRAEARRLRASVDATRMALTTSEVGLANGLIDRRTFSWTELFNRFEATLPVNVRLTAVAPRVENDRRVALTLNVSARAVSDIDEFMENLEQTGVFADMISREERRTEEDVIEASIEGLYMPPARSAPAGAAPEATR
jgi:Tfp pilus assembly protein PilN